MHNYYYYIFFCIFIIFFTLSRPHLSVTQFGHFWVPKGPYLRLAYRIYQKGVREVFHVLPCLRFRGQMSWKRPKLVNIAKKYIFSFDSKWTQMALRWSQTVPYHILGLPSPTEVKRAKVTLFTNSHTPDKVANPPVPTQPAWVWGKRRFSQSMSWYLHHVHCTKNAKESACTRCNCNLMSMYTFTFFLCCYA